MKSYIIYRCYDCNVKRVFDASKDGLAEYVEFDKHHHNHNGYIMIEKFDDKAEMQVIARIVNEWGEYAREFASKSNVVDVNDTTNKKAVTDNEGVA
ncbi:MAG: hypothetical protein QXH07_07125 [Thermoplasmata archaeon]